MVRPFALLLALALLLPSAVFASSLQADNSLDVTVAPADNAYLAGATVRVTAPLPADLIAVAGWLFIGAPIEGDALLGGGTVDLAGPVAGDVRALGGSVRIEQPVEGDIAALGATVVLNSTAKEVQIAAGRVELTGGAAGPVTIYGSTVSLGGEFDGNVRVVASDRVSLAEGTVIRGVFEYNAPQEAGIPASASVDGGVRYIGSSSFLPTAEEARTFALAGLGVLFLVRLAAAALAAGLIVGLFPVLAQKVAHEAVGRSARRFLNMFLLGLAVIVATPILIVLLLASFVGIGIAAIIGAAYLLMLLLGYLYAAALAAALLSRLLIKRRETTWQWTIAGMLALYVVGLVPGVGLLAIFIFGTAALGALINVSQEFAFRDRA